MRGASQKVRPYKVALYFGWRSSSPQAASPILRAKRDFIIPLMLNVSANTAWFSMRPVESLCRKSLRLSRIRAWRRARRSHGLARFFRASERGTLVGNGRTVVCECQKGESPRSKAVAFSLLGSPQTSTSHSSDTKYRPAPSRDMVTLGGVRPSATIVLSSSWTSAHQKLCQSPVPADADARLLLATILAVEDPDDSRDFPGTVAPLASRVGAAD